MGAVVQQGLEKGQPPALRRRGARGVAVGMLVAALATAGLALGAAARAQERRAAKAGGTLIVGQYQEGRCPCLKTGRRLAAASSPAPP